MNAVRSPEDIMPAIPPAGAAAPRVNPLQRIWLREIGMEKLWLKPAPAARQVDAQVVDLKGSVRPSGSGRTFDPASPVALPVAAAPQAQAAPGRTRRRASPRPCAAARRPPVARQEPEVAEAPLIPVAERARNATLDELREQVVSCTACGLCQDAATRSSAMAASRRAGWWWARRRANRKTARANPSSAVRASCSTPCCRPWA